MPVFTKLSSYSLGLGDAPSQGLYLLFLLCDIIVLALSPQISSETNVLFQLPVICSVLSFSKIFNSFSWVTGKTQQLKLNNINLLCLKDILEQLQRKWLCEDSLLLSLLVLVSFVVFAKSHAFRSLQLLTWAAFLSEAEARSSLFRPRDSQTALWPPTPCSLVLFYFHCWRWGWLVGF